MSLMLNESLSAPNALNTLVSSNKKVLDALRHALAKRKIAFVTTVARGTSNNAANFFKHIYELKTGVMVAKYNHSVTTIAERTTKLQDSLCIGISQSGMGDDAISVMKMAKSQGALTVAVTNNTSSPLARLCDYHLFLNCGAEESVAATKTYTMQIACMILLTKVLANENISNLDDIALNLNNYIQDMQPTRALAHSIKDINNMIILSRGETLPIAEELSLKLLETCYKLSRCYSVAEFAHGPYALIEEGREVILLAPKGIYKNDFVNITKRLKKDGAYLIAITDIDEVSNLADKSINVPYTIDNPFYYILTLQVLAATMAETLGLNPDKPRGLQKVTRTF